VEIEKKDTLAMNLLTTIKQRTEELERSILQATEHESNTEKAYKVVETLKGQLQISITNKEENISKREQDLADREEKHRVEREIFNKEKKDLELKKKRWRI